MKQSLLLISILVFSLKLMAYDSISIHRPAYLGLQFDGGKVLRTNSFVEGNNAIPHYYSLSFEYGKSAHPNSWEDIVYGMPFYGFGIYGADFFRQYDLGSPTALYLTQGATLFKLAKKLTLNYKWNLGVSWNWTPYNPFSNPENFAIGSFLNVYVSGNLQLSYSLNKEWGLVFGVGLTHFSNGASRLPNYGLNMMSTQLQLVYNLRKDKYSRWSLEEMLSIPKFQPRFEHEFLFVWSGRKIKVDTTGTNLPSSYPDKSFRVAGLTYSFIVNPNYKYKYGLSLDFLYDESASVSMGKIYNATTDKYYDVYNLGSLRQRLSLGFSLRGEIELARHSVFANIGYDVIPSGVTESRFYQVLGIKVHITKSIFGTFGVRATEFSNASFLYWSVGYIIRGKNF